MSTATYSPGSRPRLVRSALVTGTALALLIPSTAVAAVDLIGTWFMLIHYKDSATANPNSDRWEDKVWKFEKKGSRLQWTEYPIVVFNDKQGRFGRVGRNERARLLNAWEPNEAQRLEIETGLQVNSRGSKTKALRGSPKRGYKSTSRSRSTSAFTVGYEENWMIDSPAKLPVFTRDDSLGTEAALAAGEGGVSGRTQYKGLEVQDDGNLIVGTYMRDENKQGTFKLIRAGGPRGLDTDGRTPNEKAGERFQEQLQAGISSAGYSEFLKRVGPDNVRALRATIGEDGISTIWQKYEKRILSGDKSAEPEIGAALREAYEAGLEKKITAKLASGDLNGVLSGDGKGLDPETIELVRSLQETVGEEKLGELRAKYRERVKAGDEQARKEVRAEIRQAYINKLRADFAERGERANLEALQQARDASDGPGTP
jgi:hypothetical protein